MVEHGADNATGLDGVALAVGELDSGRVGEAEARARTLPERNFLRLLETSILVMERVGLEEDVGSGAEISVHNDMLEIARAEPLHPADVEQRGHSGHTADGDCHLVGGVTDEVGIDNCIRRSEGLAVLMIEAIQQVDAPGVAGAGVRTGVVHVVERLGHHVVDGTHDEVVKGNRHAFLNLIEKHGQEAIELGGAGERLIQGLLLNRPLDLERRHLVEELDVDVGLVEHVRIVGRAVSQIPAFVLGSNREAGADLLQNGAVPPVVHKDGGGGAGVGTVDENDFADVVDEGSDEAIKRVCVENRVAGIDDTVEILRDEVVFAQGLSERVVHDLINLFYFHVFFSFQFSRLVLTSDKIRDSDLIRRSDGDAENMAGCDDGGSLHPRNHRAGSAWHPRHIAVCDDAGFAAVKGGFGFGVKAVDSLLGRGIQIQSGAVYHCVTSVSHSCSSLVIMKISHEQYQIVRRLW